MLSSIEILILSFIQGVSEFLPISSIAHLVLVSKYYAFNNQNLLIDICLHLGSLLAIIIYFRNDLFSFIKNRNFLIKILIGTIPIVPAGYIFYQTGIINQFRNLEVIGWMSLLFGILLYLSDKKSINKKIETEFTNKSAIFIGLFQILELIRGSILSGFPWNLIAYSWSWSLEIIQLTPKEAHLSICSYICSVNFRKSADQICEMKGLRF